jgi:hypothetical protein
MSPIAGGGVEGSQPMKTVVLTHHVTWSPNKLWRSNSIFSLRPLPFNIQSEALSTNLSGISAVAGEETSTAAAGSNCRGAEAVVVEVGSSESRDAVVNVCSPSEDGEVPTVEIRRPFNTK